MSADIVGTTVSMQAGSQMSMEQARIKNPRIEFIRFSKWRVDAIAGT
jgi:hypothetical protein